MGFNSAFKGLNGLVRFGERRNLVSARVPSRSARAIVRDDCVGIGCILSEGDWPFVPPVQDSCRLSKTSFSFCGGMTGICHDLLGIV